MLVRGLGWLAAIVAGGATVVATLIVVDGNYCWSAFAFTMMTSGVSVATLVLGVLPSWLRFRKTRHADDKATLRLAGFSFLVLVAEAVALQVLPQRGE